MLSFLPIIKAVKKLKPNEYEEVCFDLHLHVFFFTFISWRKIDVCLALATQLLLSS